MEKNNSMSNDIDKAIQELLLGMIFLNRPLERITASETFLVENMKYARKHLERALKILRPISIDDK